MGHWVRGYFMEVWIGWSRGDERRSWGLYGPYGTGGAVVVIGIRGVLWARSRVR